MKKFIKNNWIVIVPIALLLVWFLYGLQSFLQQYYQEVELNQKIYDECKLTNADGYGCETIEEDIERTKIPPAPLLFSYLIAGSEELYYLSILAILFVAVPAIWGFYQDTKNGMYKNKLLRESYKSYFLKHYKKSLKCLLILPVFIVLAFLITCVVSNFEFQYAPGELEYGGSFFWSSREYARSLWIPYLFTMIASVTLHSIYYINTAYLVFYKAKNFILNTVGVYLAYLLTQVVLVSLVGMFFGRVLKMGEFAITFEDPIIWIFGSDVDHFEYMFISSLVYVVISTLLVFLVYRKKERHVIQNEG